MSNETDQLDEESSQATSGSTPFATDDPRFEVKWRKKDGASASRAASENESSLGEDGAEVAELRRQLAEAEQRAVDLQDRWHRAEANLANLRKRNEQERSEVEKFAGMMLVAELLPVLDNFERALNTVPGNLGMLTWVQGVMLVERHLRAILEHQGVKAVEAQAQPFDPHFHEAIGERESDAVAPGHVLQVYQQGYTMHGRTIRPALVEIAKAPVASEEPTADPSMAAEADATLPEAPSIPSEATG